MKSKPSKAQNALLALTSTAITLPGAQVLAEETGKSVEPRVIGVRFTNYQEANIDANKRNDPDLAERYDIAVTQVSLNWPLSDKWALNIDFIQDVMSGGSPWYVKPKGQIDLDTGEVTDETPVQVMTSPTLEDTRQDFSFKTTYFHDMGSLGARLGVSEEDDYTSVYGGVDFSFDFNEKQTTVSSGFSFAADRLSPTPEVTPSNRIKRENKGTFSMFAGVSQVINRVSVLQAAMSITQHNGYLSDPYKQVWVRGIPQVENRPTNKTQFVITAGYRYFFPDKNAAIHTNVRLYEDSWNMKSETFEVKWVQSLANNWQIIPSFRYYTQSQADFYAPYYLDVLEDDQNASSDYRLSPFGSISVGAQVIKKIGRWNFTGLVENYSSDKSLGIGSVQVGNPGLVDYLRFTLGFDIEFE